MHIARDQDRPVRADLMPARRFAGERLVLLCLATTLLVGFKPTTHIHSSHQVLNQGAVVRLESGLSYPKRAEAQDALTGFPTFYRGGVVGPDGFPDILFGQGTIHPDNRCHNDTPPGASCSTSDGSITYEWLGWIYDQGRRTYESRIAAARAESGSTRTQLEEEAKRVLAFTYGYLTHAAGDVFAHTLVNRYAIGIFPSVSEMVSSAASGGEHHKIGIRHIVVEGYIGNHTPAADRRLDAPHDFIVRTFIRDRDPAPANRCDGGAITVPTPLARGTHFDDFLKLRSALCTYQAGLDTSIGADELLECANPIDALLGQCVAEEVVNALKKAYANAWIDDIDDGLSAWPRMSLDVARALFDAEDHERAKTVATEFAELHILSMVGLPDAVGGGIYLAAKVGEAHT